MYQAIQQELAPQGLTLADVVAVAGEPEGILTVRPLPLRRVEIRKSQCREYPIGGLTHPRQGNYLVFPTSWRGRY